MEGIKHRTVSVNGINMHVAEKGEGPIVLFLHGFPELWYTWRHQIVAVAALGYRAVAPDLRGFGDTDAPAEVSSYSCLHVVGDIVALIESLGGGNQVFLVAHDWGAMIGWYLCLFRPDLVKAFVSLTVPFRPRHPTMKPVAAMRAFFGEDYYMCRFQEAGKMEAEIGEYGAEAVIKKILTERSPGPPRLPKEKAFGSDNNAIKLPHWFTEEDLKYYAQKYNEKGFTGGLNYYRALDLNWELTAAWTGAKVRVPVKFMVGDLDMVYNTPGVKEYVHGGGFKDDVPMLDAECVVVENTGHFINQERPHEVNACLHHYFANFL
ncbi:alpha/beta-Hydrolases superfamily protein [Perilla frutescens var. hirtella]|nr:alpha/beta-Hydrolases superfamily protein [Perilla frutescens var. hirtella]